VLAAHGWEAVGPELHAKSLDGDWKGMTGLITDEMLDEVAVSGTYETIGRKLRARYAGLLDRVSLYQPYEASVDQLRHAALVKQVAG
jgi:hypothetical protein